MKRFLLGLAAMVLAGMFGTVGTASAQTMSYAEAGALIARDCGPSIEKFCSTVNIGTGQVLQCLQKHQDQVPQKCLQDFAMAQASLAKRNAAQDSAFQVCAANAREYCPGVKAGDARILDCLNASTKVVGAACKQVLLDAGWQ